MNGFSNEPLRIDPQDNLHAVTMLRKSLDFDHIKTKEECSILVLLSFFLHAFDVIHMRNLTRT